VAADLHNAAPVTTPSTQVVASTGSPAGVPCAMHSRSDRLVNASDAGGPSPLADSFQAPLPEDLAQPVQTSFRSVLLRCVSAKPGGKAGNDADPRITDGAKQRSSPDPRRAAPIHTIQVTSAVLPLTLAISLPSDGAAPQESFLTPPYPADLAARPASRDVASGNAEPAPPAGENPVPPSPLEPPAASSQEAHPGALAFAARLSPAGTASGTEANPAVMQQSAESGSHLPIPSQFAQKLAPDSATIVRVLEAAAQRFEQTDSMIPAAPAVRQVPAVPARSEAPPSEAPPLARMEHLMEPPTPASSGHDITVRIPDATEHGAAVRFVERGGEVHVSVRTADAEMAQTLRNGLNDLVGRLEHGGISAQVWRPGSDTPSSQSDSQNQPSGQKGSSGEGRNQSGSQGREQDQADEKKPRWVEELETSIGRYAMKTGQGGDRL
jgi:hypothetical protein